MLDHQPWSGHPVPQDDLTGITPDTEIETLAAHRTKLLSHHPLHDHGRFQAPSLRSSSSIARATEIYQTLYSQVRSPYLHIAITSDTIAGFHANRA
jgi:hypothetical protein